MMPLQNRVLPTGEIVATAARGLFMGNRGGVIHDHQKRLGAARWRSNAWITCALHYKGNRREMMQPGTYTELFFLDEAVAFAAGHRPCALCRRAGYTAFQEAFAAAHDGARAAVEMDGILHAARVTRERVQITHQAEGRSLPDGVFLRHEGAPWLVLGGDILRFTSAGYTARAPRPTGIVTCLTPAPVVASFRQGFRPELHESAD